MKISDFDKELSYKIGDPRQDNGDGGIFPWEKRRNYIQRAYGRLVRILKSIMREHAPSFAKSRKYLTLTLKTDSEKNGNNITISSEDITYPLESIDELYITVNKTSNFHQVDSKAEIKGEEKAYQGKAVKIESSRYLSVKNGETDLYDAETKYFYCVLSGKIMLLPELSGKDLYYKEIEIVFAEELMSINVDSEVFIPKEYEDLLMVLAANEAMQDLGRTDKVNLYNSDIAGQIAILKSYADFKEAKKGSDTNG